MRRRTIPRTLKRLCNPSQLHYLATPCVPFHPLSRDRGLCSFAAKLLARLPAARSRFPVSDLPYIDILVERVWISIDIQKGRNTKNSICIEKFRFDFHKDNFDEKDALLYDCYNLINSTDIFFFFSASRASTLERYVMNVLITPCIYYGNRVRPCVSDFARTVLASRFTEYGISKGE